MHPGAESCNCGWSSTGETVAPVIQASYEADAVKGGGLRIAGWTMALGGALAVIVAFAMKVTVSTGLGSASFGGVDASEVVNAGLMQKQMMILQSGLAAIVAGAVLIAVGAAVGHFSVAGRGD